MTARSTRKDEAAELKVALNDPVQLAGALGLRGSPSRTGMMVHCPAHDDQNPSCSVFRTEQGTVAFKCFACGAKGDVFSLIGAVHKLDPRRQFREVIAKARELAGADVGPKEGDERLPPVDPAVVALEATALLEAFPLTETGAVADYLRGRRLFDQALAEGWGAFPVGDKSDTRLAERVREVAPTLGLVNTTGQVTHQENVLLIPWRDRHGAIGQLQRRRIGEGTPKYVSLHGFPLASLYGEEHLASSTGVVMLVEGAVDVLAARSLCAAEKLDRTVLGVPGASTWRPEWSSLFDRREVVLGFDRDDAGQAAASRIGASLMKSGASAVVRRIPRAEHKDWAALWEVAE